MTRLERLMLRVDLIDRVSNPARQITQNINAMTNGVRNGFENIAGGAVGLMGVGYALNALTDDAREMNRALGEIKSLSVADKQLKGLEQTALKFSIQYGESATDFVRSAYDIQSAITGLQGNDLSKFTETANILAKGTKSDAATITDYMGTMYGIFKEKANAMGKANWVANLAGQTATAVEMFKTTGGKIAQSFSTMGSAAESAGIGMNEQMAILGTLGASMGGGEAGSKYKAFLASYGNAQEKLGIKFTNSQGKMLPMVEVLERIKGKFNDLEVTAQSDALKAAFGSDEAVLFIKGLIKDTGGLQQSIDALGSVTGMDKATQMAKDMVDELDRMDKASTAVKISFGQLIGKSLKPLYMSVTENLSTLQKWIVKYEHFFGLIAKITIAIFAFTAAVSLLAIAKGVWIIAATGVRTGLMLLRLTMLPFGPLLAALRMAWVVFNMQMAMGAGVMASVRAALVAFRVQLVISTMSTWAMRAAMLAGKAVMLVYGAALWVMNGGLVAASAAAWVFTAALLANPITWIVLGVVALIAGLVALVVYWDEVKAAAVGFVMGFMEKWHSFRAAIENNPVMQFLLAPLLMLVDVVSYAISNLDKIPLWFTAFKNFLAGLSPFQLIGEGIDWLISKLNLIPGVNIKTSMGALPSATEQAIKPANFPPAALRANASMIAMPAAVNNANSIESNNELQRAKIGVAPLVMRSAVPAGGISSQINNSNTNKGISINKLELHSPQPVNGKTFADQLRMQVG